MASVYVSESLETVDYTTLQWSFVSQRTATRQTVFVGGCIFQNKLYQSLGFIEIKQLCKMVSLHAIIAALSSDNSASRQ